MQYESKDWGGGRQSKVVEEQVRDYLNKQNVFNLAETDGVHPKVSKEVSKVVSLPLAIIFENL